MVDSILAWRLTVFWRALIEYHACYSRMLRTLLAFCEDPSVRWPGRSPLERKAIFKLSAERRAQSAERKAIFKLSAERRAQSAERKTHYGMA